MNLLHTILDEVSAVLAQVDQLKLEEMVTMFTKEKRIFIDGEGRSGLMAKGFGMRLMHLGYEVYIIGETINPAIKSGDVLLTASGSGNSPVLLHHVQKAKEAGAKTLLVSSKSENKLAEVVDEMLVVPGTLKGDTGRARGSIQLLSTLFDQSLHLTLDALCLLISKRDKMSNEAATHLHW